ncbi:hypothetical protein ACFOKJ_03375 [Vogesella amnigena]|uniref:Uncharacterized protein n=1 Tax=Vogesella amnigena TaxID=1507449 RepID=A0ABV7TQ41_9NEIS
MDINISEATSILSLVVATLAYKHAKASSKENGEQIQKIADRHIFLFAKMELNKSSQKYVKLLHEVSCEFENIINSISYPALEINREISRLFDCHDSNYKAPYLRHAFHTVIEIVRTAYDRELTYQTGINLASRLRYLKIQIERPAPAVEVKRNSWASFFRRKKDLPINPEKFIDSSVACWENIADIQNRISSEKESIIFRDAFPKIKEFIQLHSSQFGRLDLLIEKLDDGLKENSLEQFNILDMEILGEKYKRIRGDIERIRELNLLDLNGADKFEITDGIAHLIYAGSILQIISQHFMWGKLNPMKPHF